MKTVEEIIAHLQAEKADAIEQHEMYKGIDKQAALYWFIKASTIIELLHEIEE